MGCGRTLAAIGLGLVLTSCRNAPPVPHGPSLTRVDGLGSLSFPNSGAASAQDAFLRGVLLLHSFEFSPAAEQFRRAQAADPTFALAYWGEAMTYNHPLWREQDRDAALAALGRLGPTPDARASRAPTDRERRYLAAVEALYGEGSKHDRDQAYMRAMASLEAAYPDDMEARAFHALAILGSRDGVRDFATYMRAAATVQPVFDANPDHPGAAHYLIHAFDDPVHAPLGLPAARRYSGIAPGAAHAQHMTSHIFLALGMWDDVIAANVRARDKQDADRAAHGRPANACGHYSSWLQYGYLMRGEAAKAAGLLDACHARMSASPTDSERGYFLAMRARQIIDTGDWSLASRWTWSPPAGDDARSATSRFEYGFTNAFAAAEQGDLGAARALAALGWPNDAGTGIELDELAGLIATRTGRVDEGLRRLQAAAAAEDAMPFEFGPPALQKPTFELLGEELLRAGRTGEARAAFERAEGRTPGRTAVLDGLKRSAGSQ